MVKCKTRKRNHALQDFCLEKERMMEERQAKKRQKNLDKKQQLLEQQAMTKQQLRTARMTGALMATDADELPTSVGCLTSLSAKKQEGFEIGRRNYLIKKSNKVDRKKEKRAVKNGKKQVIKLKTKLKSDRMKN